MENSPTGATGAEPGREEHEKGDRLKEAILREQVRCLIEAMGGPDYAAAVWFEDGGLDYLYRPGYVLARDEHWRDVAELLGAERLDDERSQRQRGLTVLRVPKELGTPEHLLRVDRELGLGIATPDHIVFVTPIPGKVCPATEPEELGGSPAPYPPITSDTGAGTEVLVSVVDTGWWPPAVDPGSPSPWLAGVTGDPETIDPDNIHPYAGHGTFIAGVVRTQAPAAAIRVEGFLPLGGAAYESEMVVQLGEGLELSPDIISLSAGCPTREDLPLVSFEVFWEQRLRHQKGTVLVAAAGNDS